MRARIIVSNPDLIRDQPFQLVCVVPTVGEGLLYPELAPGKSGLAKRSLALIDHLRSVNAIRLCV